MVISRIKVKRYIQSSKSRKEKVVYLFLSEYRCEISQTNEVVKRRRKHSYSINIDIIG